jgi:hypothetical protein
MGASRQDCCRFAVERGIGALRLFRAAKYKILGWNKGRMQSKWFQFPSRRNPDGFNGALNGASEASSSVQVENPQESRPASTTPAEGFALPGLDLMSFDEIYKSACIKGPRLGYSIGKVIEMAHSEHIRALPAEAKRASLLMALEAAGVQVDEVLQDATLRQRAIDSYEGIQRKHLEEYEALKAQENCAIQAEMERVSAEYAARMSNNLDAVTREKDSFCKWQTKKKHEAERIAEAMALCATQRSVKPAADQVGAFRELAASEPQYLQRG